MWALPLIGVSVDVKHTSGFTSRPMRSITTCSPKNRVINFYVESIDIYHCAVTCHRIAYYFNLLHSYKPYEKSVIDNILSQVKSKKGEIATIEALYRGVKAGGKCRIFVHCFAAL
jgi:hypothetical protein